MGREAKEIRQKPRVVQGLSGGDFSSFFGRLEPAGGSPIIDGLAHGRPRRPPIPEPSQEHRFMPHVITEPCIGVKDTACVQVCPVDCIHPRKDEAGFEASKQLFIDPNTCIDCGLCVDECPVKAIFAEDDVPAQWKQYIQLNADAFKK
jgi:ferredoxin